MYLKGLKFLLISLAVLAVYIIDVSFKAPQSAKVNVAGRAMFDFGKYNNEKAKVYITEDGKSFKTIYSDDRGNFRTDLNLNHVYMFNMSMDFHGTSKVQVDTRVPDVVANTMAGAEIEFNVPMFELYKGLNMGLLNRPLVKLKYFPNKDKFDYDKEYEKNMRIDMENFQAQSDRFKGSGADVLKSEPSKSSSTLPEKEAIAESNQDKTQRKVIEFEVEQEKVAVNKRGAKNIMEFLEPQKPEAIEEEAETFTDDSKEVVIQEKAEEEIIENSISLSVAPKRILIEESEAALDKEEKEINRLRMEKMKTRQAQEIARLDEEARIREQVRSLNQKAYEMRELRIKNKMIQTERLQRLIKTIALAELYIKQDYYSANPVNHGMVVPSVIFYNQDGFWVDEERVVVRYPEENAIFSKKIYPFGITYYYRNDEEISEESYCSTLQKYSKNTFACAN